VVRRMAEDLYLHITLRLLPTIREEDGLAMSSRNARLAPEARLLAPELYRQLSDCRSAMRDNPDKTYEVLQKARAELIEKGFSLDYLDLVDLPDMESTLTPTSDSALIVAATLGKTRLIDNLLFSD